MKPSPALGAVAELERRSQAKLWSLHLRATSLGQQRARIVAANAAARRSLLASPCWSSFACYALASHTTWTAAAASALASARARELGRGASAAAERLHWARCRRGLERRAAQTDKKVRSLRLDPWRA